MISLNGIILFVRDVDLLKNFYIRHFRCILQEEIAREWVLLRAGDCQLGLHKIGEGYRQQAAVNGDGNTKLVFEMQDDINFFHARLKDEGIAVGEIKNWEGYPYWLFDAEDPEGNVFQVKKRK